MGALIISPHRFIIKPTHFISPIFTNVSLFGVWIDKINKKALNIEMTILVRSKNQELPVLMLTGTFIVKSDEAMNVQETYIELAQHGFELISRYIEVNEIKDVFHKPFEMPPFLYSKEHFSGIILD